MLKFGMPTLIELKSDEESAALCSELGLDFIEINMSFPQYQPESMDVEKLLRLKEKYGIFYTVHIDESLDPCSVNPGIAEVYTNTMLKSVEIAKKLGIPTLNMHLLRGIYVTLPDRRTYVYAENEELYLSSMAKFRDTVTRAIGGSGIKVCIENIDDGWNAPFMLHAVDLLLESPAFALTFDIGHDYAADNMDKAFILARRDRLIHMHMHDGLGKKVHLALGDGDIKLEEYLQLAKERGLRVLVETKTADSLRRSVRWLREHGEML